MKMEFGKKASSRKGQAAMEYLMTYGWAILVLVIVIAALYYFLPKTQDTCLFQQNFECGGLPQIYVEGTNNELFVSVKLSNKLPQTVENVVLVCTDAGTGDVTSSLFADGISYPGTIGAGVSFDALEVPCVKADGSSISSNEGAGFKGILAVSYSLSSDVDPNIKHITTGTISGTVLKK
ncbi:MAG: hypothetical protein PHU63_02665 [Candidatus ainarchaeum sp.]|nr:hypothetical protein [Candidatus ainarchaeum sp.]